jgi:AmmeMemoRadiSam system protein B
MIKSFDEWSQTKANVKGIIAPHAGYMYSGKVAAAVWGKINVPETVIVIGPNHTGQGPSMSVFPEGQWVTPLGNVEIDSQLSNAIVSASGIAEADTIAHKNEHSIEVQLPFLKLANPFAKLVAIVMGDYSEFAVLDLAKAIFDNADPGKTLIVASSDFSHYEPEFTAKARDKFAIEEIKKLDWRALHDIVTTKEISMCGLGPICVAIECSKRWNAESGKLLSYSNSGFMSHDFSNVVTYAAMAFK